MTSLQTRIKQTPFEGGNFVTLDANTSLKQFTADTTGNGVNITGSFAPLGAGVGASLPAYSFLRDMGRTIVSSGITFRKVQLVSSMGTWGSNTETDGVVGAASSTTSPGYLTGYIRLPVGGVVGGTGALMTDRVARV